MNRLRTWLAILRAWGLPRSLVLSTLLAGLVLLASGETVALPFLDRAVVLTNLAPPLAGLLLGHALTSTTTGLAMARTAQRSLPACMVVRYISVQAVAVPVAIALCFAVDEALYATVAMFVAASAVLVAGLDAWYWPPIVVGAYGWLRFSQSENFILNVDVGAAMLITLFVAGGTVYVAGGIFRRSWTN